MFGGIEEILSSGCIRQPDGTVIGICRDDANPCDAEEGELREAVRKAREFDQSQKNEINAYWEASDRVDKIAGEITELNKNLESLDRAWDETNDDLADLDLEIQSLKQELFNLTKELDSTRRSLQDAQRRHEAAVDEELAIAVELESWTKRRAEIERELKRTPLEEFQREMDLRDELGQVNDKIEYLQEQYIRAHKYGLETLAIVQDIERDLAQLESQLASRKQELADKKHALDQMWKVLAEIEQDIDAVKLQIEEKSKEYDIALKMLQKYQEWKEWYDAEWRRLQEERKSAEAKVEVCKASAPT